MKKILLIFCVSGLILSCGTSTKSNASSSKESETSIVDPSEYASTITSEELKTMLYKYASDEFEGRETGEKGQKMAVEYLKAQYKAMGIPTPLGGDNYFQEVPLEKQKATEAKLSVNGKAFKSFEHHLVLAASESMAISVNDMV